jgi:hypothetical protein
MKRPEQGRRFYWCKLYQFAVPVRETRTGATTEGSQVLKPGDQKNGDQNLTSFCGKLFVCMIVGGAPAKELKKTTISKHILKN